ncbi:MAG: PIG-L family deacetylase [Actinomycetota bacterium]|nr:PIG-L family deacetylase [Actinomycetota bacterium]
MTEEDRAVPRLGTVLGVWAHPDDETYLTAGLMALGVQQGSRVVCVTATRGEEGSWDEERWPTATLGAVREQELLRSLEILGVRDHRFLDYHDGTCAQADAGEATVKVQAVMEEVQPDSVFTFGPDGMTNHPDHKSVCAWTTEAFERAGKPGARLYYATMTPEWAETFVERMNRFNVFMGPDVPPVTPRGELAILYELPADALDLKLRAIEAHVSQVEGMLNAFGQDFFREAHREEFFRLAAERPA